MSVADIAHDPHFRERATIIPVQDEDYGEVLMAAPLPRLSETPGSVRSLGPRLGSANEEIYRGLLGMSREEIARLQEYRRNLKSSETRRKSSTMNIRRLVVAIATAMALVLPVAGRAASPPSVRPLRIGVFPPCVRSSWSGQCARSKMPATRSPGTTSSRGFPPEGAAMAAGSMDFGEVDTSGIEQVAAHSPSVMWCIANGAMNYVALVARKGAASRPLPT